MIKRCGVREVNTTRKARKNFLILTLVMAVLLVAGCAPYVSRDEKEDIQQKMTAYLTSRYDKEFVVQEPRLVGNEGLGYNLFAAKAYPKDQTSLLFNVVWDKDGKAEDDYLNKRWTKEGKKHVESILKDIYGEDMLVVYNNFYYFGQELDANLNELKDLNYADLINGHGATLGCHMDYFVFVDSNYDKKAEAEKVYKFYDEYFKKYGFNTYIVSISYIQREYKAEYVERFKAHNYETMGFTREEADKLKSEKIILNTLRFSCPIDKLSQITKPDDLISKFEY